MDFLRKLGQQLGQLWQGMSTADCRLLTHLLLKLRRGAQAAATEANVRELPEEAAPGNHSSNEDEKG